MANYTTKDIKELRELTGAGMMDVKKALDEAGGDRDEAIKIIRLAGQKSLAKREDRSAAAGLVAADITDTDAGQVGVLVEVNSETDFVAKNEKFVAFADSVLAAAVSSEASTLDELMAATTPEGKTVKEAADEMAALVGEKIVVNRIARISGEAVTKYLHYSNKDLPAQAGVLVATDKAGAEGAQDVAMHIAAYQPQYLDRDEVPADVVAKERDTLEELTRSEGKPEKIISRIVEGRLGAFYKEICLVDQDFARDPSMTVGAFMKSTGGKVTGFARFHVGA
ncbi:elongation factor Ts [Nanchangia anserum]|uniref:Elongation factor Ts n=1 Tax=Nanchangia anserum TaxID=2692125 RepID=A0A8I0KPK3_9ACTO|nr:translation elongation factor Ts [Nanchangia anserum]MBD3688985.1 elongation factor Ts [Nanchangia anserum]QOX81236.1 elongation factor Ts [Nanchangia anserum]